MKAILLTQACKAAITFLIIMVIKRRKLSGHKALLALFYFVFFADNLIITLTARNSSLQMIRSHTWGGFLELNWSGKQYGIIFSLLLLFLFRWLISRQQAGLTLRQVKGSS